MVHRTAQPYRFEHRPVRPVRALVGDQADGNTAQAVSDEYHRVVAVGVDGGEHGRDIVVVANPGTIFVEGSSSGQGRGDDAVAVAAQVITHAVPAPGAPRCW